MLKLVALVVAFFGAIWTFIFGWETVPLTERRQLIGVSAETSAALGEEAFDKVLRESRVLGDGETVAAVRAVTARLAPHANEIAGTDYQWDLAVVEDPAPNAFALPNGNIAVQTGILPVTGLEDGLAAVVGHEMAHVVARHAEERLTQAEIARLGEVAASVLLSGSDPATQAAIFGALGLGAEFGILRPFSRAHESEADRIGMILMARACYDPRAAPAVWQRMAQSAGGQPPEILSTHPAHESRIAALTAAVEEAMAARREAGCPPLPNQRPS